MLDEREVDAVERVVRPLRAETEPDAVVGLEERETKCKDETIDDDVLARPRPSAVAETSANAEDRVAWRGAVIRVRSGVFGKAGCREGEDGKDE